MVLHTNIGTLLLETKKPMPSMFCENPRTMSQTSLLFPLLLCISCNCISTSVIFCDKNVSGRGLNWEGAHDVEWGVHVKIKSTHLFDLLVYEGSPRWTETSYLIWYHRLSFVCTIYLVADQNAILFYI